MSYTRIKVQVVDQTMQLTSLPALASGGVNENLVEFTFCPLWDGLGKTAVFYRDPSKVYHVVLANDNTCTVPAEVAAEAGAVYFGVFGAKGDQVRTSEVLTLTFEQGAIVSGALVSDPTPDIYQQLLALAEETRNIVAESEQKIQDLNYAAGSWTPQINGDAPEVMTASGRFVKVGNIVDLVCTLVGNFYGKGDTLDISGFSPTCGTPNLPWLTGGVMQSNAFDKTMEVSNAVELVVTDDQFYLRIDNPVTSPTQGDCIIFIKAEYTTDDVLDQSEGGAVSSVNGKTGAVVLSADDIGAVPKTGGEFTGDVLVKIGGDYVRLTQGAIEINNTETDNGFFINSVGDAAEPLAEFIGSAFDAPVRLTNIATPKLNSDAATKRYVDNLVAALRAELSGS